MAKERREIKYVAIEEIMSDKLINKIIKAFDKRTNKNDTYDEFERILKDSDLKPFRCGTNRYVFNHKKFKKHVVKIAADAHGVRANRREFYNSSIHERLTQSLSISPDGHILVQEKIEPITSWSTFQEYWKKIDKLLWNLHEYFLVVDLSMTSKSMGNFGIRKLKDGGEEVVACDHGDIVPYDDYQLKTVDFDEESLVSLKCRNTPNHDGKVCKGKLEPHGNWEFLKCDKCKKIIKFHEAYRDIVGDIMNGPEKEKASYKSMSEDVINEFKRLQDERDKQFIYLSINNKNVEKKKEDTTMNPFYGLTIHNGYYLPVPNNPYAELLHNNVINGISSLEEYFEAVDEDMEKFRVKERFIGSTIPPAIPHQPEVVDQSEDESNDEQEDEDIPDTTFDDINPNAADIADSDYEDVTDEYDDEDSEDDDDDDDDEPTGRIGASTGVVGHRDHGPSRISFDNDDDDDDDGNDIVEDYNALDYPLYELVRGDDFTEADVADIRAELDEFDGLIKSDAPIGDIAKMYDISDHLIDPEQAVNPAMDAYIIEQYVLFYKLIAAIDAMLIDDELEYVCSTEINYFIKDIRPVYYQLVKDVLITLYDSIGELFTMPIPTADKLSRYALDMLSQFHSKLTEHGSKTAHIVASIMFDLPKEVRVPFDNLILDDIIHKDIKDLKGKLLTVSFEHNGKLKSITFDIHNHVNQLIKHNIITDNEDSYIMDVCGLDIWSTNADEIDYDKVYADLYSQQE